MQERTELLQFPTDFPIKILGVSRPDFAEVISEVIREEAPDYDPASTKADYSKTGKYTGLTAVVHATSLEQLNRIYLKLTSHPMVKLVF